VPLLLVNQAGPVSILICHPANDFQVSFKVISQLPTQLPVAIALYIHGLHGVFIRQSQNPGLIWKVKPNQHSSSTSILFANAE